MLLKELKELIEFLEDLADSMCEDCKDNNEGILRRWISRLKEPDEGRRDE